MVRRAEEETVRCHVHIFKEDKEKLEALFGPGSKNPIGFSHAVRKILRTFLKGAESRAIANAKPITELEPEV